MKLTLKTEHGEYSVEEDATTLSEVLPLMDRLLKAAGFIPKGVLDFVNQGD